MTQSGRDRNKSHRIRIAFKIARNKNSFRTRRGVNHRRPNSVCTFIQRSVASGSVLFTYINVFYATDLYMKLHTELGRLWCKLHPLKNDWFTGQWQQKYSLLVLNVFYSFSYILLDS